MLSIRAGVIAASTAIWLNIRGRETSRRDRHVAYPPGAASMIGAEMLLSRPEVPCTSKRWRGALQIDDRGCAVVRCESIFATRTSWQSHASPQSRPQLLWMTLLGLVPDSAEQRYPCRLGELAREAKSAVCTGG